MTSGCDLHHLEWTVGIIRTMDVQSVILDFLLCVCFRVDVLTSGFSLEPLERTFKHSDWILNASRIPSGPTSVECSGPFGRVRIHYVEVVKAIA